MCCSCSCTLYILYMLSISQCIISRLYYNSRCWLTVVVVVVAWGCMLECLLHRRDIYHKNTSSLYIIVTTTLKKNKTWISNMVIFSPAILTKRTANANHQSPLYNCYYYFLINLEIKHGKFFFSNIDKKNSKCFVCHVSMMRELLTRIIE